MTSTCKRVNHCQWAGCTYDATHQIKRGVYMDYMYVCPSHREAFHRLTFEEAARVYETRKPPRHHRAGAFKWLTTYTSRD